MDDNKNVQPPKDVLYNNINEGATNFLHILTTVSAN